ncbi:OVARIAN TUMOR DOMAIN-containing deubiquitinating enzyme 2-like [Elaeis guineensis]|uniref:OVARIAN TUMOR DOMAIN-containing deubiquitinating enzyme 2-like n=1 Tax=Elaeis guineensis var. tenera TaxID=51953 RepID=UPI003C6D3EE3
MDHDKHRAPELSQVIAATVVSDPRKYNQAFLGKSNEEYCGWILNPEKWGGIWHGLDNTSRHRRVNASCWCSRVLFKLR